MISRLLLLALCLSLLLRGQPAMEPHTLTVDGRVRTFLLFRPAATGRMPLIIAFHGAGGDGAGMAKLMRMNPLAAARGVMVVYPDGLSKHWGDSRSIVPRVMAQGDNDVAFTRALIDHLVRTANADPTRVYATGMSNGGFFTARLGCELSDRIAAIAVVAATLPERLSRPGVCAARVPLPAILIHGDHDPLVPPAGGPNVGFPPYGGPILSAEASARFWASLNHCNAGPASTGASSRVDDGTSIVEYTWSGCARSEVRFYDVAGGGHTWPSGPQYLPVRLIGRTSRNLDASAAILDFFLRYARR